MVNKHINNSLTSHIEKVNSGKNYTHKEKKNYKSILKKSIKSTKEYFCPRDKYEQTDINSDSLGKKSVIVVKKIEKGFLKHIKQLIKFLKVFSKTIKEKVSENKEAKKLINEKLE